MGCNAPASLTWRMPRSSTIFSGSSPLAAMASNTSCAWLLEIASEASNWQAEATTPARYRSPQRHSGSLDMRPARSLRGSQPSGPPLPERPAAAPEEPCGRHGVAGQLFGVGALDVELAPNAIALRSGSSQAAPTARNDNESGRIRTAPGRGREQAVIVRGLFFTRITTVRLREELPMARLLVDRPTTFQHPA